MTLLFGGAISLEIPIDYVDARYLSICNLSSDFRPIPSHQEVFVDSNSDSSLIIEILEMVNIETDSMAE